MSLIYLPEFFQEGEQESNKQLQSTVQVDNSVPITSDDLYDAFEKAGFSGSDANYDSSTGLWYVTYRGKTTAMTEEEYREWNRQQNGDLLDLVDNFKKSFNIKREYETDDTSESELEDNWGGKRPLPPGAITEPRIPGWTAPKLTSLERPESSLEDNDGTEESSTPKASGLPEFSGWNTPKITKLELPSESEIENNDGDPVLEKYLASKSKSSVINTPKVSLDEPPESEVEDNWGGPEPTKSSKSKVKPGLPNLPAVEAIDVTRLTDSSEKLGESVADIVSDIIYPSISEAINDIEIELDGDGDVDSTDSTISASRPDRSSRKSISEDKLKYISSNMSNNIAKSLETESSRLLESSGESESNESDQGFKSISGNDVATDAFNVRLKDNLYRAIDITTSELEKSIKDIVSEDWNNIKTSVANTAIDSVNSAGQEVIDTIAQFRNTVYIDSYMDVANAAARSANQIMNYANGYVHQLSSDAQGLTDTISRAENRILSAVTDEPLAAANQWVQNNIMSNFDTAAARLSRGVDNAVDSLINRLPWRRKAQNRTPNYMKNNWEYLRKTSLDSTYYRFVTTYDWLIKIVPHYTNGNVTIPDLRKILNIDSPYLPILNYNLVESGLESMGFSFLSNNLVIPQGYRRPSRLSITLPDMYVKGSTKSYLRLFKDNFIKFVKNVDNNPVYSLVSRDYRDCCYELTLYRFPYVVDKSDVTTELDQISFHKTYLGIPDISITESGNETKQLVTDTLNFNIVGEIK